MRTSFICLLRWTENCALKDVINSMAYSSYMGGPITIDHENIIKAYSASPSMLGRGHTLMDPQGPVWVGICGCLVSRSSLLMYIMQSISASEYHPQLAAGSADGTCATTNTLRTTRRGGSVVRVNEFNTPSTLTIMLTAILRS